MRTLSFSRFIALALALALATATPQAAQQARQQPPAPGPMRPFEFPKHQSKKLASGLTVFVIEDHRQPLVSYRLEIPGAGGVAQPAGKAGLTGLAANLIREGTRTRNAQQLAREVDNTGGSLDAVAGPDTTAVFGTFMKSYGELGMGLLADIVINPTFPQEELDRLLRRSLSGLQVSYTDPEFLLQVVGPRAVYGDHPYGAPVDGTPDTLRAIKREDIVRFHRERYAPAGAFLAVSGDITPAEAFARAEKHLGGWNTPAPAAIAVKPPPAPARQVVIVDKPDAVQTQFSISQLGFPRNHPDHIPLLIANQAFGGGFNSRLNMRLRAAEGLTYGARSQIASLRLAGRFYAGSFSRTETTAQAIRIMAELIREFRENPVTEAELKEAKAYLTGSFALSVETADAVAQRVMTSALNGLPDDYWNTFRDRVQATTAEQIQAAVKRHIFPDAMRIVAVGNASGFSKELAALGPSQVIPLAELDVTAPDMVRPKAAAPAATAESKARAIEWVRRAAQAIGGPAALLAVKDMASKGTMKLTTPGGEMQAEVSEEVLFPDKYKLELGLPIGKVVQAFDGKLAWMQQGPNTRDFPPAMNQEMIRSLLTAAGVGVLREALEGRAEVLPLDPVEVEGKKMNAAVWKAAGIELKLLFDPETHRLARLGYRSSGPMGSAEVDMAWSDWRDHAGLQLPAKTIILQNGQKSAERTITERKLNGGLAAAGFSKP